MVLFDLQFLYQLARRLPLLELQIGDRPGHKEMVDDLDMVCATVVLAAAMRLIHARNNNAETIPRLVIVRALAGN